MAVVDGVLVVVSGVPVFGFIVAVSGVGAVFSQVAKTGKLTKIEEAIYFNIITTLDIYLLCNI